MAGAARIGDSLTGTTTADHHYHMAQNCYPVTDYDALGNPIGTHTECDPPYRVYDPAVAITGTISSGSSNVFINNQGAAFSGSSTSETDSYDTGSGTVSSGSSNVFVNGKALARNGDNITPHNGTASISGSSGNVFAN